MSEGERERWRDNGTFGEASDRWLLRHGRRCIHEQGVDFEALRRAQRVASASDETLMFDYYFKSRTSTQLGERLEVLLRNPRADDLQASNVGSVTAKRRKKKSSKSSPRAVRVPREIQIESASAISDSVPACVDECEEGALDTGGDATISG